MQKELNNLCIGLPIMLVVVVVVIIIVDFIVVGVVILNAMFSMCHVKITTLWLSIATVSIKGHPLWSLGRCKTVLHLLILNVLIVAKKVILQVIANSNNVLVGSSVVEVVNPVVIHVVGAPVEANFRHNVVAKIRIIGSLILYNFPPPQKTDFGQLPCLWICV